MAGRKQNVSKDSGVNQPHPMQRLVWVGVTLLVATLSVGLILQRRVQDRAHVATDASLTRRPSDSPAGKPIVTPAASWHGNDDPRVDGWDSEVFSAQAASQLAKIGKSLTSATPLDRQELDLLLAPSFRCQNLLPPLVECYRDQALIVERMAARQPADDESHPKTFDGVDGMIHAMSPVKKLLGNAGEAHSKFKVFRVDPSGGQITTRQYVLLSGSNSRRTIQLNATWEARWQLAKDRQPPRLLSIIVEDVEKVSTRGAQTQKLFSDCTESALAGNASYKQQLKLGWNHWLQRGQDDHHNFILSTPGLAIGDVDGDGLEDLYLCQEAGLPNRLFRQQRDGSLIDISKDAGVDWLVNSRSALLADLDNDGDQDLAVAVLGGIVIAKGDGRGKFSIHLVLPTSDDVMSLSAADFDQDGRLDLYVCAYAPSSFLEQSVNVSLAAESANFVYHDANNGAENHLFRNETSSDADWQFRDVTDEYGLNENNQRWSLAASWEDFDNDGDQDLYVANDYGRNNLYRNDFDANGQRRFVDIAAMAGAEDSASGMSVSWSDYDQDGWMDIYISNMFSAAGNRIAYQDRFKHDAPSDVKKRLQRFARGNTLLRNQRDGTFVDVSLDTGVTLGRWAWGSRFIDINNDGHEDLVVANGYITTDDTSDL